MFWFRSFLRSIIIGIIAAIGGIFGNLAATVAQETFFRINIATVIATIAGMVIAVLLHATIENWPDRNAEKLTAELEKHRANLKTLLDVHQGGENWTDYHAVAWHEHQTAIATIKQQLIERGSQVAYSMWDDYPQPKASRPVRVVEFLKRTFLLFLFLPLSFASVFLFSNDVHQAYLNIVRRDVQTPLEPTPTPDISVTLEATATIATPTSNTSESGNDLEPTIEATRTPGLTPENRLTPTPSSQVITLSSAIELRTGPGTDYPLMDGQQSDGEARVLGQYFDGSATWYNVELSDGTRGWILQQNNEPVIPNATPPIPTVVTVPPTPFITPTVGSAAVNTVVPTPTSTTITTFATLLSAEKIEENDLSMDIQVSLVLQDSVNYWYNLRAYAPENPEIGWQGRPWDPSSGIGLVGLGIDSLICTGQFETSSVLIELIGGTKACNSDGQCEYGPSATYATEIFSISKVWCP